MSGFYDDGGVGFAQEQFDNARKRRDKEAKKQDKFSQRLFLTDLAAKGFNLALNNKADKLEQEALFENSNLFSEVEASTSFLNFYNEEKNKGLDDKSIFRNYVNNDFARLIDPNDEGYVVDARDELVNDYINDVTNFNNFKGMIKHHQKIGSLDSEQLTEFIKSGVKAPRNIGELIGNKIKKITMSHTDETLQAKDAQVKSEVIDRLAKLGFNFGDSAPTYEGSYSAIEQEIRNNPDKYKPYIRNEFDEPVYMTKGNKLIPTLVITKAYKDGDFVFKTVPIDDLAKTNPIVEVTGEQLTNNKSLYQELYLKMEYMENIAPGFRKDFKELGNRGNENLEILFGETIELGKRHILANYSNIVSDPVTALEYSVASMYQNHQKGRHTGKPSLYELDMIILEKTGNVEGFDDVAGKLAMYLDDFEKNYTKAERGPRILEMLKELPQQFTEESDIDSANIILEQKGYPTIEEFDATNKALQEIEEILEKQKEEEEEESTFSPFFNYNKKFKDNPLS